MADYEKMTASLISTDRHSWESPSPSKIELFLFLSRDSTVDNRTIISCRFVSLWENLGPHAMMLQLLSYEKNLRKFWTD